MDGRRRRRGPPCVCLGRPPRAPASSLSRGRSRSSSCPLSPTMWPSPNRVSTNCQFLSCSVRRMPQAPHASDFAADFCARSSVQLRIQRRRPRPRPPRRSHAPPRAPTVLPVLPLPERRRWENGSDSLSDFCVRVCFNSIPLHSPLSPLPRRRSGPHSPAIARFYALSRLLAPSLSLSRMLLRRLCATAHPTHPLNHLFPSALLRSPSSHLAPSAFL